MYNVSKNNAVIPPIIIEFMLYIVRQKVFDVQSPRKTINSQSDILLCVRYNLIIQIDLRFGCSLHSAMVYLFRRHRFAVIQI